MLIKAMTVRGGLTHFLKIRKYVYIIIIKIIVIHSLYNLKYIKGGAAL